jgi:DNA polymerase-3 subunit alpha
VVAQITETRQSKGAFVSFADFCRKVDPGALHKKVLESLILSGAFDSMGYTRRALFEGYDKVLIPILSDRRADAIGQGLLLSEEMGTALELDESVLQGPEFEKPELLKHEKEMLGQWVTDHPLLAVRARLEAQTDMEIVELPSLGDGDIVTVGGVITTLARRNTKKGEPYVLFRVEDLAGGVQVVGFPSVYERSADLLAPDRVVLVKGRIDLRGRELQIVALEIRELGTEEGAARPAPGDPLLLEMPVRQCVNGMVVRLKEVLASHPGEVPVVLRLLSDGAASDGARQNGPPTEGTQLDGAHQTTLRLGDGYRVDGSAGLLAELRTLLGAEAVRVVSTV